MGYPHEAVLYHLVPVYNHPDCLEWLVSNLRETGMHTLMVNDGSDANCSDLLRRISDREQWITLIERERNGVRAQQLKRGCGRPRWATLTLCNWMPMVSTTWLIFPTY